MTKNKEWNTKIVSTEQGEIAMEIVKEFHQLWDSKYALFYDDFYENYKQKYEIIKKQREIAKGTRYLPRRSISWNRILCR